jgi:predicted HicB family RNase H-like nuclease
MSQPEPDTEPLQTYVSLSVKKRLEKAAASEERSVAAYVRRLLEQHVRRIK